MKTRDGWEIEAWQCPACRRYHVGSVTRCHCGHVAGNGQKTAIAPDPHADTQDAATTARTGSEADMAKKLEDWMTHAGWWPRDDKHLDGTTPPLGWWIHNRKCEGNFYLLDYLVLDFARGWYEFELKTATGRIRKVQTRIMQAEPNHCALFRSLQDAIDAIRQRFEMA